MENTYKIRIHSGRVETRFGVDVASFVDDPNNPKYKGDDIEKKLMEMLSYEEADDKDSEYPGYYDNYVGAYFDYDGYIDVDIPKSIVKSILRDGQRVVDKNICPKPIIEEVPVLKYFK